MEDREFWCRAFLAAMGASYVDETRRGVVHSQMADYADAAADAALSVASQRGMVTGEPAGRPDVEPPEAERVEFTAERDGDIWTIRGGPPLANGVQVRTGGERYPVGPLDVLYVKWSETMPPKPIEVWLERGGVPR